MTRDEVRGLLKDAAAFDGRPVSEDMVEAWYGVLRPLIASQAWTAMQNHFATSDRRLMPVHIVDGVKEVRTELMRDFQDAGQTLEIPDADPDDVGAYLAAVKAQRVRAGNGAERKRPVQAMLEAVERGLGLPSFPVREATPMAVQCPRCKALVGRPCRTAHRSRAPHEERVTDLAEWKRSRSA